jgi:tetratricopeptide (TPR) repeat protein
VPSEAGHYALLAAKQALKRLAFEDAIGHIERGLHALSLGGHDASARAELLLALAEARTSLADREGARDAARRAADEARTTDPALFASAAISHADWGAFGQSDPESIGLLREALTLLGEEDSASRARVLAMLGSTLSLEGDPESGGDLADRAVAIARTVEDPVTLWSALWARNISLEGSADVGQRLAVTRELVQLGQELGDPSLYLPALENEQYAMVELGDMTRFDSYLDSFGVEQENIRAGRRQLKRGFGPVGFSSWEVPLVSTRDRAFLALMRGGWDEAEALVKQGGRLATIETRDTFYTNVFAGQLVHLRREQGRAREVLPGAQAMLKSQPGFSVVEVTVALLACDANDVALAHDHLSAVTRERCTLLTRGLTWTATLSMLGEVCTGLGDTRRSRVVYELFRPHTGHLVIFANLLACRGSVDRYLGMLEAVLGDWDAAEAHFEAALALEERIESPPLIARTKYWYGSMLLQRDKPDMQRARVLLNEAFDLAKQLDMTRLAGQAQERLEVRAGKR